ncbi:HAMP domain-containing histidine kinase [Crossiella sp. SN42]|uniref:sensor histidine kinase n=1 Tax=Crossiella sp. SN42 TaxID=2944808 RepID=UPI00207CE0B4|nr:HAMP domain-containing sensor histidine kinase [Crossiella sp. SN42]MCO1582519.1 HAMP domain-containing histidine kinase [Crossiella sp. SN42]
MRRALTLHARLLLTLLLLSGLGLAVVAVTSHLLLAQSLMSKVDEQLRGLARPFATDRPPPRMRPPEDHRPDRQLPTDVRVLFFSAGGDLWDSLGNLPGDINGPDLSGLDRAKALAHNERPFEVPDRSGGSDWRVRAAVTPTGDTVVTAHSLAGLDATLNQLLLIELVVGVLVLGLLGAAATAVVRIGLRPLTRIEHTAQAIAGGELDRRVPDEDPRTETGRLGAALNVMLGRLGDALRAREQSEGRLRLFVGDASHELRTPLTSIRGFAELYRKGGAPERADVDRIMSRIEAEASRMGLLVDDLLLLAQLDQQRLFDFAEVDLLVLAGDAAHDARALDDGRKITLVAKDGPVRVLGDEYRLRQVLANLVTNALRHTPAGTPVRITLTREPAAAQRAAPAAAAGTAPPTGGEVAVLEVADDGPGIPPEHAAHVFDRFYRADPGRSRAKGGSGLGLAITAAIVHAHGGRVELHTAQGSRFRVLLPLV